MAHDEIDGAYSICPPEHWEKHGYIPDTCLADENIPNGWRECMEHCIEPYESIDDPAADLTAKGFRVIDNPF